MEIRHINDQEELRRLLDKGQRSTAWSLATSFPHAGTAQYVETHFKNEMVQFMRETPTNNHATLANFFKGQTNLYLVLMAESGEFFDNVHPYALLTGAAFVETRGFFTIRESAEVEVKSLR